MDDKTEDYFLRLVARDAGPLTFKTYGDLIQWLDAERDFWSWSDKVQTNKLGLADDKRSQFTNWITQARNNFEAAKGEQTHNAFNSAKTNLDHYTNSGLISSTPRAKFIANLQSLNQGDIAAAAALAAFLGSALNNTPQNHPADTRYASALGRTAIMLFDLANLERTGSAFKQSIAETMERLSRYFQEQSTTNMEALNSLRANQAKILEGFDTATTEAKTEIASLISETTSKRNEAIDAINLTNKTYNEFMKLKATVTYWDKKASAHWWGSFMWGGMFTLFAIAGSFSLYCLFTQAFTIAEKLAQAQTNYFSPPFVVLAFAIGVASTIAFWIARFLSRLFMSERNLRIDAQLRSTLAQTYLALTQDGKVDEGDRALILPALFKHTNDGLSSDDGGIDGLLGVVVRYLEKK